MENHNRDSSSTVESERGSVFILTTLLIVALLALGVTFLTVATTDRRISSNASDSAKAFALAEAGLEDARSDLPGMDLSALLNAGGGALLTNVALGGGTYSVVASNNIATRFPTALVPIDPGGALADTDRWLLLTSTAQYRTARRITEVVVRVPFAVFGNAFWANSKVNISGGGSTDSYNSGVGPYVGPGGSDGDVFANNEVKTSGGSVINGDAGSHVSITATVTGTSSVPVPTQTMPIVSCPGSYAPAANVSSGAGITYDPVTGDLDVSGGHNVVVTNPPSTLFFSRINLSGGSTLTIVDGGAHTDIYVSGGMVTSGGGVVNTSALPTRLTMYACGASTTQWVLSGGSGAYYAVYAPNRKVTISGSGDVWGAIVAGEIDSSGGSGMHYDAALAANNNATVVARSWREVIP